jgi:hypothetical protein
MSSTGITSITATSTSAATASCISVTPGQNGYVPEWACNSNYNYDPSFTAALIFATLFGITTVLHIGQAFAHKKLRLCWTLIMGTGWEFSSFVIRTLGTRNQQNATFALVSQILVLLAPMVRKIGFPKFFIALSSDLLPSSHALQVLSKEAFFP